MPRFLFQPDSIDGVCFKPIKIDIHKGVIKIVDLLWFSIKKIEPVIVGRAGEEVLRIQRAFESVS